MTFMLNEQLAVLFDGSLAVHKTEVTPELNAVPEGGLHVTDIEPLLSVAGGRAKLIGVDAVLAGTTTEKSPGQVITGGVVSGVKLVTVTLNWQVSVKPVAVEVHITTVFPT